MSQDKKLPLFEAALVKPALAESLRKLSPRVQWRSPVMFVVWVGSLLTTVLGLEAAWRGAPPSSAFPRA